MNRVPCLFVLPSADLVAEELVRHRVRVVLLLPGRPVPDRSRLDALSAFAVSWRAVGSAAEFAAALAAGACAVVSGADGEQHAFVRGALERGVRLIPLPLPPR